MILKIRDALDTINPDRDLIARTELLLMVKTQKKKVQIYRSLATAASLLFIMSVLSVAGYGYYQHPVNYIDFDINPSLDLQINAFNRVVAVTYLNEDAESLISEDTLTGCKPDEAVTLILEAASDKGYILDGETSVVSLAAYGRNEEKAQAVLQKCTDAVSSQYENVAVYCTTVSSDLKVEAEAVSMSAGKLCLIKMIQTLDATATVDDFRDASVSSIVHRIAYLSSDENTDASDDSKKTVIPDIKDVTSQMQRIQEKIHSGDEQAGEPQSFHSSSQHDGTEQIDISPLPKPSDNGSDHSNMEQPVPASPTPTDNLQTSGQDTISSTPPYRGNEQNNSPNTSGQSHDNATRNLPPSTN